MITLPTRIIEEVRVFLASKRCKDIEVKSEGSTLISYTFNLSICSQEISLKLIIPNDKKWTRIPSIQFLTCPFAALDHVGNDGLICITDHQGENFSPTNYIPLVDYVFTQGINIITQSLQNLKDSNRSELYNELEGYFSTLMGIKETIQLHHDPEDSSPLFGWVKPCPQKDKLFSVKHIVGDNNSTYNHLTKMKVDKILLDEASKFPIPDMGKTFSKKDFLQLINLLSEGEQKKATTKGRHIVLIGVPNKHGYAYITATYFSDISGQISKFNIFLVQRVWRDYLLNRTGQREISKHVAIIGCGSLGSRVAEFLAQTGIKEISLIDNDILKTDNIYRHTLGLPDVNRYKTTALATKIRSERPGIIIHDFPKEALWWVKTKFNSQIDTLVLTTGHFPAEKEIVNYIYDLEKPFNVVSAWIEAYDLGGHILSFSTARKGCLECLFYDITNAKDLIPKTSYIEPDQHISKNITGCAGAFTPFSSLSSIKIASMICEAILTNYQGLISIAGNDSLCKENNIKTTEYWSKVNLKNGIERKTLDDIKVAVCTCCNT